MVHRHRQRAPYGHVSVIGLRRERSGPRRAASVRRGGNNAPAAGLLSSLPAAAPTAAPGRVPLRRGPSAATPASGDTPPTRPSDSARALPGSVRSPPACVRPRNTPRSADPVPPPASDPVSPPSLQRESPPYIPRCLPVYLLRPALPPADTTRSPPPDAPSPQLETFPAQPQSYAPGIAPTPVPRRGTAAADPAGSRHRNRRLPSQIRPFAPAGCRAPDTAAALEASGRCRHLRCRFPPAATRDRTTVSRTADTHPGPSGRGAARSAAATPPAPCRLSIRQSAPQAPAHPRTPAIPLSE